MKTVVIPSTGDPGTFVPLVSGDPTFNTEGASFDLRKLFYDLNQEGYNVVQVETGDVDDVVTWIQSVNTTLRAFISDVETYLKGEGDYPDLPTLPSLPSAYDTFYRAVLPIVLRFYLTIQACDLKRVDKVFADSLLFGLNTIAAGENTIDIGNIRVFSRSIAVDNVV